MMVREMTRQELDALPVGTIVVPVTGGVGLSVAAVHAALTAAMVRYGYVESTDPPGRELAVAFIEALNPAAYVGALRRMWRDSEQYGTNPLHPATGGYRDAIRDLAHELGVDLNG